MLLRIFAFMSIRPIILLLLLMSFSGFRIWVMLVWKHEALIFYSPPDFMGHCARGGVYDECVSQLFPPAFMFFFFFLSFVRCVGVIQLVSEFFFSRANCSVYICRFNVSVGRGEFRVLLHHHLEFGLVPFFCNLLQEGG